MDLLKTKPNSFAPSFLRKLSAFSLQCIRGTAASTMLPLSSGTIPLKGPRNDSKIKFHPLHVVKREKKTQKHKNREP
ncbi:MAG: hypothetical protein O7C56_02195, partial [Rickettsia endosymbiont of Ixodes persulcatus]|nr:hypothetical protein [Rickettsia endosymbiont of Ixodes persulcatus]